MYNPHIPQNVPFSDSNPQVEKFAEFLPQIGFRQLSSARPTDLPAGSLVVLYNITTFSFETVVVKNIEDNIFFYNYQAGNFHNTWRHALCGDKSSYLFKVIS